MNLEEFVAAFMLFSGMPWSSCLGHWLVMQNMCSYWIAFTTLTTTHHDPSVYHPGMVHGTSSS